jgi:signal peptidase II
VIMRIALAMQMGGALGNLIDRLRFGPVTDFIAVGDSRCFNIADASITVGVAILLVFSMAAGAQGKSRNARVEQVQQEFSETT